MEALPDHDMKTAAAASTPLLGAKAYEQTVGTLEGRTAPQRATNQQSDSLEEVDESLVVIGFKAGRDACSWMNPPQAKSVQLLHQVRSYGGKNNRVRNKDGHVEQMANCPKREHQLVVIGDCLTKGVFRAKP